LNDTDRENPKDLRINFPSATMSTTIGSWTGPGLKPVFRFERSKASGNVCGVQPELYRQQAQLWVVYEKEKKKHFIKKLNEGSKR